MNNIENIQEYIPTVYVNDSEPDLDETNLNKTEQAIKRVTDAANKAIDALKQLDREKLALSAISNVLSDATDKVPSLALANTMQRAINDLNSNLNKRVYYSDSVIALQSPVVNNVTYRFQVDSRSGGVILYKSEDNGLNWERDKKILSNADFLTKIVSLNQVTVPANAGITVSTTNISGQIPSGYKLLDAREVGSGNNGCYIYYFKVDGTNITLQLRNVTNNAITTSPAAQLLLIPK